MLQNQTSPWTWDNLVRPLDALDNTLERFFSPMAHLHAVNDSAVLRDCFSACLPMLSAHESTLSHHDGLYRALKTINTTSLNATQRYLMQQKLRDFELDGVLLSSFQKTHLDDINARLDTLSHQFENHVLDAENKASFHLDAPEALAGLPDDERQRAQQNATDQGLSGWLLKLNYPTYRAVLTHAHDRDLRQTIHHAYTTRASDKDLAAHEFDNSALIDEILMLRAEKARLLGFTDFAAYSLSTKMAQNPQTVSDFLLDLHARIRPQAQHEFTELSAFAQQQLNLDTLEPWDIAYVSELKKQQQLGVSDEQIRAYFPLPHVLNGLITIIQKLYGIRLTELTEPMERWHPDVNVYSLEDNNQQPRGIVYLDLFARPNKRGGAWMDSLQSYQLLPDGSYQLPIATLTCNFAPPVSPTQPATLLHDDALTLFHEFGHCLHHLLTEVNERGGAGIHGVEWDAVELPSQFFENWCWDHASVQLISAHVSSHEPLPEGLFNQLLTTRQFQAAIHIMKQIEWASVDLRLHEITDTSALTIHHAVESVITEVKTQHSILPHAAYERPLHSFSHIFAGGYAAGYYSYLWAEILACDAFQRFRDEGLFNPDTGKAFLQCILARGGSRPIQESFRDFRGQDATPEAFLDHHGIH